MSSGNNQAWVAVCPIKQLPADKAISLNVAGQRLIAARCGDEAKVLQGFCSHMLFPLANSRLDDCVLVCGLHQSKFDIDNGSVVEWVSASPILDNLTGSSKRGLKVYETQILNGILYLRWNTTNPEDVQVTIQL